MAATTGWQPPLTQPDFSDILKEQETFGTGRGEGAADQINSWFDELMLQPDSGNQRGRYSRVEFNSRAANISDGISQPRLARRFNACGS